jgi:hypothetical protein
VLQLVEGDVALHGACGWREWLEPPGQKRRRRPNGLDGKREVDLQQQNGCERL